MTEIGDRIDVDSRCGFVTIPDSHWLLALGGLGHLGQIGWCFTLSYPAQLFRTHLSHVQSALLCFSSRTTPLCLVHLAFTSNSHLARAYV